VDAFAVQHASHDTEPIALVFGLIGLYLYLEKNYTGRQVQRAHMQLARHRRPWMAPAIPDPCAQVGVAEVMAAPPGVERREMIHLWCQAVWRDWQHSRPEIVALAERELGVRP
jgi:hypothetical protein